MITLMFKCPLVVLLLFFNTRVSYCYLGYHVFSIILKITFIPKLIQYYITKMRFLKQTILPPSVKLILLIAICKIGLRFLQYKENTIFENNWKPEEITICQDSSFCSNTLITGTEKENYT